MVSPLSLDGVGSHLTSVAVLAQLSVRLRLECDHIGAGSVLEAVWLDPDAAYPVVPAGVDLAVNVHVFAAHLVGNFEFLEFIALDSVIDGGGVDILCLHGGLRNGLD